MEKRKIRSFTWVYVIAFIVALAALGIGVYRLASATVSTTGGEVNDWTMIGVGCLGLIAIFVTLPIALSLGAQNAARNETEDLFGPLTERIDQIAILLNLMSEQQLLSDRAKSVAFREKDLEALRRAIQEDMSKQDWDAAFILADEIERGFGYKSEANRFREEIKAKQQDTARKQINDAVAVIDRHTRAEQWPAALREAERLLGVFPDNEQVRNLPAEIEQRRQAHKKQLQDSWHEAVARHDVDGSIEILKQLDPYLSRPEAEAMQEAARGVFKEKLATLGKTFSTAIKEGKWAEAIRVGDTIVAEFPNTRIAQEVRDKMQQLRQRATEPAASTAST